MLTKDIIGLIVLLSCVLLFVFKPIALCASAVCGCVALVAFGACSFKIAFSGFSSEIVILMTCAMIVGIAMFKTGCARIIGDWVVNISHNNEKALMFTSCSVASLMAMFLANTAVLASFIPIIDSVCSSSKKISRLNIVLPLACSVMFGGACTLIGCTPQLTANGIMKAFGFEQMGMFTLFVPGFFMLLVFILYMFIFGYKYQNTIWKKHGSSIHPYNSQNTIYDGVTLDCGIMASNNCFHSDNVYDRKKIIMMTVVLVLMILSYALSVIPAVMTALISALLCICLRLCDVSDVEKELNWGSVVFLAGCLGLAEGITSAGTANLMGKAVFAVLKGFSSRFAIFSILVLLTLVISQFITNSTAIMIVLPIALPVAKASNISAMTICLGITFASSIACCTPLAAAQITMTQVAGYDFKDYVKFGLPLSVIEYLAILIFVPLFFPF